MDYFIIQPDPELVAMGHIAKLRDWRQALEEDDPANYFAVVPIRTRCIFVESDGRNEYPDFWERPILMIEQKFKRLISTHQKDIQMQTIVLLDQEANKQTVYYKLEAPKIDCASDQSVLDHIGKIKELVIDKSKVGEQTIFHVTNFPRRLIVRLDVAERILQKNSYGITFEKIKSVEGV